MANTSRNNYPYFKDLLIEMTEHSVESVRNTGSFLLADNAPVYIMHEDIVLGKKFSLNEHGHYVNLDEMCKSAAAATFGSIFLHPRYYYMNETIKMDEDCLKMTVSKPYTTSLKEKLFCLLAHETNHIINRKQVFADAKDYISKYNLWSQNERERWKAKDEFHAYFTAQHSILGLRIEDIESSIQKSYSPSLSCEETEAAFQLDWNTNNEF